MYGDQVLTSRMWLTFLRWFENAISQTEGRIVIDATEGGAKIEGTKIMTLREVIDQYCQKQYPIQETIDAFFEKSPRLSIDDFEKCLKLLDKISEEIKFVQKESKKGLDLLDELKTLYKRPIANHKEIQKILRRLDRIDEKIITYEDGKLFLQIIFQPLVMPIINGPDSKAKPGETEEEASERIIRHSSRLYIALRDIAELVAEMIDNTREDFANEINRSA